MLPEVMILNVDVLGWVSSLEDAPVREHLSYLQKPCRILLVENL